MAEHLNGSEVRRKLGISTATYHRWLKSGRLKGVRVGRAWRFPESEINRLLQSGAAASMVLDKEVRLMVEVLKAAKVGDREAQVLAEGDPAEALVRLAVRQGLAARAPAIHLDPEGERVRMRMRVDGALVTGPLLAGATGPAVAAVVSRLAGLGGSRTDRGRFLLDLGARKVDVTAAIYPGARGPSIALQMIDPDTAIPRLSELGFSPALTASIRRAALRGGLFIVNGPRRSGKTTTIYSLLREVARPDLKVMTVESPIELLLEGVQQAEIGPDFDFVAALRAMIFSDVDVAMVSEVRDDETMKLCVDMAASGARVLTVLHAPDAASALARVSSLLGGSYPTLADAVSGILDQRLVRKVCPRCVERTPAGASEAERLGLEPGRKVASGRGCVECRKTGFLGSTAVGEMLTVTPAVRAALPEGDAAGIRAVAALDTMRRELAAKVAAGEVAPAEALRVLEERGVK